MLPPLARGCVFKLFENHPAEYELDELGQVSGLAIEPGEFFLEALPRDVLGQLEKGMGAIGLILKVRERIPA